MSETQTIDVHESWLAYLEPEFEQPYMQELSAFLREQKQQGKRIFPRGNLMFNALNSTTLDSVRVVILGQDPYHGPGQAHGLCFSVPEGVPVPPSLQNIFRELHDDVGIDVPSHGNLQHWADQGVLLLNAVLSVEESNAGSHANRGWEQFTDAVIALVNRECKNTVFMLWGAYAQKKGALIDAEKHLVLKSPHPSPLSAHRGFLGCRHFSKANAWLREHGFAEIHW